MAYLLLTGATGLLGRSLLRDCLLAGHRMAVLVRATERQSAWQRVDVLLSQWEERTGQLLPRPVVLEGDLCRPDLGLSTSAVHWITRHCRAVIHSAASLTFVGADRQQEPWLSNVEGTRHVLDLCARCGIRQFHHVSTAYVCGLRRGRILETELDVGQEMGNDYERTKVEAEKLVLGASLPEPPTIYRPSIIVGDSQTGHTSAFYGFYAVVKFAHTLARHMVLGSISAKLLFRSYGLSGRERKDYVPVDWVSAVMTHILSHSEHHGRTYHLTAAKPTPTSIWSRAIQEAVEENTPLADPSDPTKRDAAWFKEMLGPQIEIYRPYWRDDPKFDRRHTTAAAPNLPCPTVDRDMLVRMARFAIRTNFGRCPDIREPLPCEIPVHLQRLLAARDGQTASNGCLHVGLQINGPGGGQWKLLARGDHLLAAEEGIDDRCHATVELTSDAFRRLATQEMSVSQAIDQDQVIIAGNGHPSSVLKGLLQTVVTSEVA